MVIGHRRQIRYLERALAKGALAHAYLFHGPEEVGKKTVALAVARSLLCERPQPAPAVVLGGCRTCEGCRGVDAFTHPDLFVLALGWLLVAEDNTREIGIRNIHELQRRLALSAWRGGRKVVIIDGAEALSAEASSALLKTLEEPDAATTFFIITSSPGAILETIRSRSVPMSFTAVGEDEITGLLGGVPPARRRSIAALAAGRPGLILRLARETEFFEEFQEAEAERAELCRADLGEQLDFSERASPRRGRSPGATVVRHSAELVSRGASREPLTIESFLEYLMRHERSELLSGLPTAGTAERASFLRSLLERVALLQTTTVNRRLVADSVFVELAAAGGRYPA